MKLILCWLPVHIVLILLFGFLNIPGLEINVLDKSKSAGFFKLRLEEAKEQEDLDILFLGSSITYRGFDPRIFKHYGFKTFNLGSSNQTPTQTNYLLKRYLNQMKPGLVIYEIYPGPFTNDGIEATLDLISNESIDSDLAKLAVESKNLKVGQSFIFHLFKNIFNIETPVEGTRKNDKYVKGGFVENNQKDLVSENRKFGNKNILKSQLEIFKENIKMLKSESIDVILVQAPVTNEWSESYPNFQGFYDQIDELNIPFYNFTKLELLNDQLHFYDFNHLNLEGVKIFNDHLINALIKDNIIPNNNRIRFETSNNKE